MNPLITAMGNNNPMISQFINFAKSFNGDPGAILQSMVQQGKISKSQLDEAVKTAKELEPILSKFIK